MKPAIKKIIKPFFLLFLSIIYDLSSTISLAQSVNGLSAIPPRSEIEVEAGKTYTQSIKVRNESSETKQLLFPFATSSSPTTKVLLISLIVFLKASVIVGLPVPGSNFPPLL
jgi:hypothetical protein